MSTTMSAMAALVFVLACVGMAAIAWSIRDYLDGSYTAEDAVDDAWEDFAP